MVAHAGFPFFALLFENSRKNLPSLGSHMGLPLPKPPQNRCCLWNQNSAIIHRIKPLRRLTPPPRPFRGGKYSSTLLYNVSPLKGYSPVRGNVCDSRQKGACFRRKRCHERDRGVLLLPLVHGIIQLCLPLPSDFVCHLPQRGRLLRLHL